MINIEIAEIRSDDHERLEARPPATLDEIHTYMRHAMASGGDQLPAPGAGETGKRWQVLRELGGQDLSLARIFESHAEGLAILSEFGESHFEKDLLAVWTEPSSEPIHYDEARRSITGINPWCAGASIVNEALVCAQTGDGEQVLVRIRMDHVGVTIGRSRWASAGLAAAGIRPVEFDAARAIPVGEVNAYTDRPGYWHRAAGIAAMWQGAATAICRNLLVEARRRSNLQIEGHVGSVHARLEAGRAMLRKTARWIDSNPAANAFARAAALRTVVEHAATETIQHCGRVLGSEPLVTDFDYARRVADLQICLEQAQVDRTTAELGAAVIARGSIEAW